MSRNFFIYTLSYLFSISLLFSNELIRLDGSHESVLHLVEKYLPQNPIIIEAGAFDGSDSVQMASKWPKSTLYSFEPISTGFNRLVERTKGINNINCFKLALGEFTGKATFYISNFIDWPELSSAASSILPPGKHLEYGGNINFDETEECDVMLLDEWASLYEINHIDFMWLDMQGYELNMLKCSQLALTAKVIYAEMIFIEAYKGQYLYHDIVAWMEANGFKLIAIDFEPDQPFRKIEPATYYPPGRAWFGNGVFINTKLN